MISMLKSRYVKFGLAALIVLAVFAVLAFQSTATAQEVQDCKRAGWKARGIAIIRNENETIKRRIMLGIAFKAHATNRTIRLHAIKGAIKIGDVKYNITEAAGVIGRIHHVGEYYAGLMMIKGTAVSQSGEKFTFRLFGRVIYVHGKKLAFTAITGSIRGEPGKGFLVLEGLIKLVNAK